MTNLFSIFLCTICIIYFNPLYIWVSLIIVCLTKKVTCHKLRKIILNNNDFCKYKIFESMNEDIFSYGAFNEYYYLRKDGPWLRSLERLHLYLFRCPLWGAFQVSDWVDFSSSRTVMIGYIVCCQPSPLKFLVSWKSIENSESWILEQTIVTTKLHFQHTFSSQINYLKK